MSIKRFKQTIPIVSGQFIKDSQDWASFINNCNRQGFKIVREAPVGNRLWVLFVTGTEAVEREADVPDEIGRDGETLKIYRDPELP